MTCCRYGKQKFLNVLPPRAYQGKPWDSVPTSTWAEQGPGADCLQTPHQLTVKEVPMDGFWSINVYNAEG